MKTKCVLIIRYFVIFISFLSSVACIPVLMIMYRTSFTFYYGQWGYICQRDDLNMSHPIISPISVTHYPNGVSAFLSKRQVKAQTVDIWNWSENDFLFCVEKLGFIIYSIRCIMSWCHNTLPVSFKDYFTTLETIHSNACRKNGVFS